MQAMPAMIVSPRVTLLACTGHAMIRTVWMERAVVHRLKKPRESSTTGVITVGHLQSNGHLRRRVDIKSLNMARTKTPTEDRWNDRSARSSPPRARGDQQVYRSRLSRPRRSPLYAEPPTPHVRHVELHRVGELAGGWVPLVRHDALLRLVGHPLPASLAP
jgi:hypothetical protein